MLDVADLALVIAVALVKGCRSTVGLRCRPSRGLCERRRQMPALSQERGVVSLGIRCLMLGTREIISVGCTSGMPVCHRR